MANKVTFKGNEIILKGDVLKVGDIAPNFIAVKSDVSEFDFYSFAKDKKCIIASYPSVDTPVCATEAKKLNQSVNENNVPIVAISADLPFALGRFCAQESIDSLEVVSDHKKLDFGNKYGVIFDELRVLSRAIFGVNADGTIGYIEIVSEVTNEPDYSKIIQWINS